MASRGLLGAVAGLGQGLVKMGENIERRREQALQWAREEARRQEDRRVRSAEREEDRNLTMARTLVTQRQANRRQDQSLSFRAKEGEINRQFRAGDREDRQAEARALVELRGRIARQNSESAARFRRQLEENDVVGVIYDDVERNSDGSVTSIVRGRRPGGGMVELGRVRRFRGSGNDDTSGAPDL